jgi:hypothetical protein
VTVAGQGRSVDDPVSIESLKEPAMETPSLIAAAVTVAGTLVVSLAGSYVGARLASRSRWTDRISEALPKFYAAAVSAWYAWQRHALAAESRSESTSPAEMSAYYNEHINTYRDLLATSATLAVLLPKDRRQKVWDLLDLWEATSDPHSGEHENRWMERVHELVNVTLDLIGRTAPLFPGQG